MRLSLCVAFLAFAGIANAGRVVDTTPIAASATQEKASKSGAGPSFSSCATNVHIRNISSIPQTVRVQLHSQEIGTGLFLPNGTAGLSGWSADVGGWRSHNRSRSESDVKTFVVNPSTSNGVGWNAVRRFYKSAVSGASWDMHPIPLPWSELDSVPNGDCSNLSLLPPNALCGAAMNTVVTARVTVAEDRGALLGMISVRCYLGNAEDFREVAPRLELNGGRPF